MCRSERNLVDAWIINKVKFQTQLQLKVSSATGWLTRRYKVVQSKSTRRAHEDRLAMPDRCPFKSKFLTRSPGPSVVEWQGGLQAAGAWHDNQSQIQTPEPGERWAAGDKWILKSLASALQTLWQWAHASPPSFFCIQQHLSSLSELITELLVSGTIYHRATDGNWIPLIRLNKGQRIKGDDAEGEKKKSLNIRPAGWHAALTWPAGHRGEEVCLLQLQGPRGDSFISNVSIYAALNIP